MPHKKNRFKAGLRIQIALGVALPVLVGLVFLSSFHSRREQQLLDKQTLQTAIQIGEVINSSLRHSMLFHDHQTLEQTLADVSDVDSISRIQIVDENGEVKADTTGTSVGTVHRLTENGCVECHQYEPSQRPHSVLLSSSPGILRIAVPIRNDEECMVCHTGTASHLGVLFVDEPLQVLEEHVAEDLGVEIVISIGATLLGAVVLYLLLHWLVVRRVEKFNRYLEAYADGDFSARVPIPLYGQDELDKLAATFNRMADELERNTQEVLERQNIRQKAVTEERERIARELHDGMAQLIGFVNTKATAIRLLLQNRQIREAETNLNQLEEAAQGLSVDVREAILGLNTAGQVGSGLVSVLRNYVAQFSRLSDLPVNVSIPLEVEDLPLSAETELQILRIVQEALSNVRKHTVAAKASLSITKDDHVLRVVVADDGEGFDPEGLCKDDPPRFGLCSMRERAEAIGGTFTIESAPGAGTRVIVTLPLENEEVG
ncbi:MAG: HAMP domain-containing protein [Chloroflexi bacterium]|nr:HAMP domain-containing protein [Chloroflexota bacterium]